MFFRNDSLSQNDLALLELNENLQYDRLVSFIKLQETNEDMSGMAVFAGWGYYERIFFKSMPKTLQFTEVPIIDYKGTNHNLWIINIFYIYLKNHLINKQMLEKPVVLYGRQPALHVCKFGGIRKINLI